MTEETAPNENPAVVEDAAPAVVENPPAESSDMGDAAAKVPVPDEPVAEILPPEEAPPAFDMEALRAELNTQLAAHLDDVDKRIDDFLDCNVEPMIQRIRNVEEGLSMVAKAAEASTPDGFAKLLQDVEAVKNDLTGLAGRVKHFL